MPISITGGGIVTGNVSFANTVTFSNNVVFPSATIAGNVAFTSNNVTIAGQTIAPSYGMKNRIINGDMRIDQRNAGAAVTAVGSGKYIIDRWFAGATADSKLRFQQNNTNGPGLNATLNATGFPYYFGANVVSSNTVNASDAWYLGHSLEGFNTADFAWGTANASPVTLSFWTYSSVPGTHGATVIASSSSTGINNDSYPFTYTINSANTWEYKTVTIPGPTAGGTSTWFANNNIGMAIYFTLGVGSAYNRSNTFSWGTPYQNWPAGTVNVVSNANGSFYLTGVQLEKGSVATPFEFRHYSVELALCQRYCQWLPFNVTGYQAAGGNVICTVPYKVTMRVVPTFAALTADPNAVQSTINNAGNYFLAPYSGVDGTAAFATPSVTGSVQVIGYRSLITAELLYNN